jgi:hypothetical protein
MATSKSTSSASREPATAGLLFFSGRRDPVWQVSDEQFAALDQIWQSLAPAEQPWTPAPPLGYRGVWLRCPAGREITGYLGKVRRVEGNAAEVRDDPGRRFEQALLATAPADLVPPAVLRVVFPPPAAGS